MNTADKECRECRVVVGLRAAVDIEPPVDAATALAAAIEAEVVGLFIEEEAMLDLASLPFARAVSAGAGQPTPLSRDQMKEAFYRGALTCERTLSARARSAQVKWSFVSERGTVSDRIKAVLSSGDFVVLSSVEQGFGAHDLIEELRAIPQHARGVVIAARRRARSQHGPVIAIDDGDELGKATVTLAARLASATGAQLMLFSVAASDAEAERIIRRARDVAGPGVSIDVHRFLPGAPRTIAAGFMHFMPSFVVADLAGEPFGDDRTALDLLRASKAPVVLLRAEPQANEESDRSAL